MKAPLFWIVVLLPFAEVAVRADEAPASKPLPQKVRYARDIQPILSAHCFVCHGPDERNRKARLRLDVRDSAVKPARSSLVPFAPGKPKESEALARIFSDGPDRMPPAKSNHTLKQHEKELIRLWVEQGAEYEPHWAFQVPKRPPLPEVKNAGWVRRPLDRFLLARLEALGLKPAPEADRWTLARRAALDLTGLPPTLEEADRFVKDASPDAYEKYVDALLAKPAFGERWAHLWLDLARYADSNGYATDNLRTIWKYRDWVIDAFNRNLPYDRFTIEQLAGDLLPDPTTDQLIATAFHRNTLTNDEGGTSDEEFRTAAVVDRVNTTLQVWMGITMNCAQCHDHKYDPISQEEYFRFYAILNQTEDADRGDNSPTLPTPEPGQVERKQKLEKALADLESKFLAPLPELDKAQAAWETTALKDPKLPAPIRKILAVPEAKRNAAQKLEVKRHYRGTVPQTKALAGDIDRTKKEIASIKFVSTPIMRELPENRRRVTKVHLRGNFLELGKEVQPGLPEAFPALPKGARADRLGMARWLVDPANPLTARVAVDRFWAGIFGNHLVDTPEDFGIRCKPPEMLDLLDWLAVEFREPTPNTGEKVQPWDMKRFLKMLVTSAAYRQSARVDAALLERDPDNRLLARGPRFRNSAEVIRDQALFVAGLLSDKMHGPPVRPPAPKIGLSAAFGSGTDWQTSAGEDKYRRGLYTQWRRTTPYPSMITFDAPSRTVCTVARPRTNTPLQALTTLNDPVYVEAAQALARRMVKEGGKTAAERIAYGFRLCLVRPPSEKETQRLESLFTQARTVFAADKQAATKMATEPLGPLPAGSDPADMAAWTVVGNVLLNLDEFLAKR